MMDCKECEEKVSDDWEYCFKCGAKIDEPSRKFIYDQLFELMKLETSRSAQLDSKAHTYIGFLSIAITILGSFGGLLIENIKSQGLILSNIIIIISILYVLVALLFIIGVIFAFKAYHTGSIKINEEYGDHVPLNVFVGMDVDWLAKKSGRRLSHVQNYLIPHLRWIYLRNYRLNNEKSNNILNAYMCTIIAVFLLLGMIVVIGLYGTGII
jgi:hypothetical protein